jgi:S-formylglutathione hydrolase FrmB
LQAQLGLFDRAIAEGRVPPFILAAPDGSLKGRATALKPAMFWTNSKAGAFEDYVMCDIWNFMHANFSVRPGREAHALTGASMGGSAAFTLAMKHKDRVKTAIGFAPLLNLRYVDCHGKYRTPFDPCCFGLREQMNGLEALGRRRLFTLRFDTLFAPLFGRGDDAIPYLAAINPYELLDTIAPGELNLYVAYGGRDEFNVAAQVESFLYKARCRGIEVTADCDPEGGHDLSTGLKLFPNAVRWTAERSPGVH